MKCTHVIKWYGIIRFYAIWRALNCASSQGSNLATLVYAPIFLQDAGREVGVG